MLTKRLVLLLTFALLATSMACSRKRPPRDAKVIKESEVNMNSETPAAKPKPVGGGGAQLKESQW